MPTLYPTGAVRDPENLKDLHITSVLPTSVRIDLPRQFSLRDQLWFKAFLQKYGECVAGGGRYAMQFYLNKWRGEQKILSDRFLYGRAKELDYLSGEGTYPRNMLMVMFGIGAPLYDRWPQEPSPTHQDFIASPPDDVREEAIINKLDGGFAKVTSYEELKRAIISFGPVMVTLTVLDTYDGVDSTGHVKPSTGSGNRGPHENIAIGWNDDTGEIELLNQWGEGWGDDGFCFLPLNYMPWANFPLYDMWAITDLISAAGTQGAPIALGYPVETASPFVTQGFGARPEYYIKYGMNGHNGIDFRTIGTSRYIIAAHDGEVLALNPNDGGYGRSVRLRHPWGMSIYAHNSQFLIPATNSDGTPYQVKRGQRIAIAGATGDAAGEHCHFGIRINGVKNPGFFDWVDPTPYFKEQSMTKFFRVQQGTTSGILIIEGFGGSIIWEDKWADYQQLLAITGMSMSSPLINLPAGKKFRIEDHGKAGIIILGEGGGPIVFENDWAEYQTLLKISDMSMSTPLVMVP